MVRLFLLLEGHHVLHLGRLEPRAQCSTHLLLYLSHLLLLFFSDVVDMELIHFCLSLLLYGLLLELSTMLFSHTRCLLLTLPAIFILELRNQGTGLSLGRRGKLPQCSLPLCPCSMRQSTHFSFNHPLHMHSLLMLSLAEGFLLLNGHLLGPSNFSSHHFCPEGAFPLRIQDHCLGPLQSLPQSIILVCNLVGIRSHLMDQPRANLEIRDDLPWA